VVIVVGPQLATPEESVDSANRYKRFEVDLIAGICATLVCFGFLSGQQMTNGLPIA